MATRITGEKLLLEFDGVQYECDAVSVTLEHEEDDRISADFCNAEPVRGKFSITGKTSMGATGFWPMLWDNAGEKNVPFTYAPAGNETPTADEWHFTGFIDIPKAKPAMGGEAGTSEFQFDVELLTTKNTVITTLKA